MPENLLAGNISFQYLPLYNGLRREANPFTVLENKREAHPCKEESREFILIGKEDLLLWLREELSRNV
jgi:hypothetical protein